MNRLIFFKKVALKDIFFSVNREIDRKVDIDLVIERVKGNNSAYIVMSCLF